MGLLKGGQVTKSVPRISDAHRRRKALRRRGIKPKSLSEVLQPLGKAQFSTAPQRKLEENIVKVKCSRLRGRTHVIGTTPFKFNEDGECLVDLNERPMASADVKHLLKMNGVTVLEDSKSTPPSVEEVVSSDMTVNEVRECLELPPFEDGDVSMDPLSVLEPDPEAVAEPDPEAVAEPDPEASPEPEPKPQSEPKKKTSRRKSKKKEK